MKQIWSKIKGFFSGSIEADPTNAEMCIVKDVVKNAFNVFFEYQKSKDANSAGGSKTTAIELAGIAKESLPLIKNLKNWQSIKARLASYSYDDGKDLIEFVISKGVVPAQAAEIVAHLVEYVELQIVAYNTHGTHIVAAIKKMIQK